MVETGVRITSRFGLDAMISPRKQFFGESMHARLLQVSASSVDLFFGHLDYISGGNRSDDRGLVSLRYLFEESPGFIGQTAR